MPSSGATWALLLGCFSCIYAVSFWHQRSLLWRLLVLAAAALGALASLLSGSRGGWLALLPMFFMLMVLVRMYRRSTSGACCWAALQLWWRWPP